jgi:hypothetical protein
VKGSLGEGQGTKGEGAMPGAEDEVLRENQHVKTSGPTMKMGEGGGVWEADVGEPEPGGSLLLAILTPRLDGCSSLSAGIRVFSGACIDEAPPTPHRDRGPEGWAGAERHSPCTPNVFPGGRG